MSEAGPRVLVVEDDRTTADLVALYLRHAGMRVFVEHDGDAALRRIDAESFDLLVLDVMLPGVDGLEICRRVRAGGEAAVILLTARTRENDRVEGLDLGADDYVTKPFSPRELTARVRAVLRRAPRDPSRRLHRGALTIDLDARTVSLDGEPVSLTPTEYSFLVQLARHPGHVKSRADLLSGLETRDTDALERTVDVHMRNLRRKIEADPDAPRRIETVHGVGYRFVADA